MVTEKEKMLSGEMYDARDPQLTAERQRARDLCKALNESDPAKQVEALLALARVTGTCPQHRKDSTPPVDTAMRDKMLIASLEIDLPKLDATSQLTLQRTIQIILTRFGRPDDATCQLPD